MKHASRRTTCHRPLCRNPHCSIQISHSKPSTSPHTLSVCLLLRIFLTLLRAPSPADSHVRILAPPGGSPPGQGIPCVHEGHLRTDRNWYGYLANISVLSTGRMTFDFSYPADRGCQNILFYSDDQMSIINARMNCWQKEYLLRPEEDQILRLTPRFSWSGCHMTHPNGVPTYVCEGGRSFTIESPPPPGGRPMTWYVAVSNCNSLDGLDMQYRLVVYSHVGDCPTARTASTLEDDAALAVSNPRTKDVDSSELEVLPGKLCVLDGELNTTSNWFGFIANLSLARGGGFRFRFTYPTALRVQNVILYREDDLARLNRDQTCWQKEGVIRTRSIPDQILDLDSTSSWNGCVTRNESGKGGVLECVAGRRYDEGRRIALAVSNCRSTVGLVLRYHVEVYGYLLGDVCGGPRGLAGSLRLVAAVIAMMMMLNMCGANQGIL